MLTASDTLDDLVSGIDALAQVSEQQARSAAQSAAPGQVVSSTLDDDNGCLVCSGFKVVRR